MPDCPLCGFLLLLHSDGAICHGCDRNFSPVEMVNLPGFDFKLVQDAIDFMVSLISNEELEDRYYEVMVSDNQLIVIGGENLAKFKMGG